MVAMRSIFIAFISPFLFLGAEQNKQKRAAEKEIEIQILFPKKSVPNHCLIINVLSINHTDSVASFFEDWNSWGYFNIGF